jgi:hypothetical protein
MLFPLREESNTNDPFKKGSNDARSLAEFLVTTFSRWSLRGWIKLFGHYPNALGEANIYVTVFERNRSLSEKIPKNRAGFKLKWYLTEFRSRIIKKWTQRVKTSFFRSTRLVQIKTSLTRRTNKKWSQCVEIIAFHSEHVSLIKINWIKKENENK